MKYPYLLTSSAGSVVVTSDDEFVDALNSLDEIDHDAEIDLVSTGDYPLTDTYDLHYSACIREQLEEIWWGIALNPNLSEYRPTKQDVDLWEDVGTYVTTFPMGTDPNGACDVTVQIGCDAPGVSWFVRTVDSSGGADSTADKPFTYAAVRAEAYRLIEALDEGMGMTAKNYLAWRSDSETTEQDS